MSKDSQLYYAVIAGYLTMFLLAKDGTLALAILAFVPGLALAVADMNKKK